MPLSFMMTKTQTFIAYFTQNKVTEIYRYADDFYKFFTPKVEKLLFLKSATY